jgi:dGTPase
MAASTYELTRIAKDESAQTQRDTRRSGQPGHGAEGDPRSPSRRDRDKILYSSALQRLTGVTQVVTPEPGGALTHNRLTHSLKVAQVARSIAELLLSQESNHPDLLALGGLDVDVAEAAALAHDLGHPPFGHIGEAVLDTFAREDLHLVEGFEGNAQTFRIAARLDVRSPSYDGMDLTAATRCAILKYPWPRIEEDTPEEEHRRRLDNDREYELRWTKFGYYAEEEEDFKQARSIPGVTAELQSVEAAIMDLADDVTYALHDLQDFYLARVLPIPVVIKKLDGYLEGPEDQDGSTKDGRGSAIGGLARRLGRNYPERYNEILFFKAVRAIRSDIKTNFAEHFDPTPEAVANLSKYVSRKIGQLTQDIRITQEPTGERAAVHLRDDLWHQVQVLKHLTSEQVIGRPDMAVYQRAQQRTLLDLLKAMKAWWDDPDDMLRLPQALLGWRARAQEEGRSPERCLLDFVAGLSDHQAAGLRHGLLDGGRGLLQALVL